MVLLGILYVTHYTLYDNKILKNNNNNKINIIYYIYDRPIKRTQYADSRRIKTFSVDHIQTSLLRRL